MRETADTEKILIFNVNWLWERLFSTPVIRNIRYNFPGAFIACVIPPRCLPVLQGNPYLDEIIIFDEKKEHRGLAGKLAFCRRLRREKFNRVYLLHRSFSRALITWLAGIPERIGYRTGKRDFLLTHGLTAPDIFSTHRADYYLDVIRQAGLSIRDRHTDFSITDEHRAKADAIVAGFCVAGDFLIGVNPGGNWAPKRWPKENFSLLVRRLVDEFAAKVIITGSSEDAGLAAEIQRESGRAALSVCGTCGLKEFAALARRLDLFITADSGPLHIAAASRAGNIIALFGPTDPKLTGPVQAERTVVIQKSVGCKIPCYTVDCADNRCMKAISVDDVLAQVRTIRQPAR